MKWFLLTTVLFTALFVGCKGSQKSIKLTVDSPIYDSAPHIREPLHAKVEYEINFDE